jgi:hypothetical protein
VELRRDLQGEIIPRFGNGHRPAAGFWPGPRRPSGEASGEIGEHPPETPLVVDGLAQHLGLSKVVRAGRTPPEVEDWKLEPEVDGLLRGLREDGRRARATSACSKRATASWFAERVAALLPAWRRYVTAFSQASPWKA